MSPSRIDERAAPPIATASSPPGTRPEGAQDESDAARQVREMFSRIAPRYDFLNHLLSFSFDRWWRRRAARHFRHILRRPEARVLDLCCGTGDLTFALERAAKAGNAQNGAQILGSDFALPMLALARAKANRQNRCSRFVASDALALPFADASFDLVTAAFGFRNLANYERGLQEIARILRPGGELAILEFAEPQGRLFAPVYRFYFTKILPRIGGAISGSAAAYRYLPGSVGKFPSPEELRSLIERAGFRNAGFATWMGGIVALHQGQK
jgi:demethylmenaquinone methyltransferase / 2-methoxy-6-polyprenyl-1,4-benzoquinol methylase